MNIEYLIEEENRVALESLNAYSDVIRNTENIIALLNQIVYIQNEQATAFYCLNKNSQHGLYQCLLSLLRRHDVQAQLMLRHAMETACLAVYSLHNTSLENYIVNDEFGSKPVKPIKDKAYNWIHKHYPEMSDKLKVAKSLINDFYAHGNLFASLISLTRRNDGVDIIDYFDRKRDGITQTAQIWKVGYIACIIFILIYETAKTSEAVNVNLEIYSQFKTLLAESQELRLSFIAEKRFEKLYKHLANATVKG